MSLGVRSHVVVDLGTGAAGAGLAHLPEIVLVAESEYPFVRDRREFGPEFRGFVIAVMHRRPQALRIEPQIVDQEFPGESNRIPFEVVAKRKVPQHLEERVVSGRPADFLEIVVLAAHPEAFLRRDGTRSRSLLLADEYSLELDHPGVREQQSRIRFRDERTARQVQVPLSLEVLDEA